MNKVNEIIGKISSLPPLSRSAGRLIELLSAPSYSLQDVISVIETDSALTANVLRYANSAAFNRGGEVASLDRAVSLMGSKMVIGIAMELCAPQIYGTSLVGYDAGSGELWQHSLRTAIASREFAQFTGGLVSRDLAYTAGLLHDIGKSVISDFLRGELKSIIAALDEGKMEDFAQAEKEDLGIDHALAGAAMARHWKLPTPLLAAIRYHHSPKEADPELQPLVYAVHLGDMTAMMGGTATGADAMLYKLDADYKKYIPLNNQDLETIMMVVDIEFEKIKSLLFGEAKEQ